MRTLPSLFCATVLLAGAPALAQPDPLPETRSAPNFLGATGLLMTPSAYTVGRFAAAAHVYGGSRFNSYGAQFGPHERLELGFSYLDIHGPDGCACGDDRVVANGKLNLLRETRGTPAFSVGVVDAFDELDLDPGWYVVASKDLTPLIPGNRVGLRAHLGYGAGIYSDEFFGGIELSLTRPGIGRSFRRPSVDLLAEYVDRDMNVGLRGRWRGFSLTLGLLDFDRVTGGISYTATFR